MWNGRETLPNGSGYEPVRVQYIHTADSSTIITSTNTCFHVSMPSCSPKTQWLCCVCVCVYVRERQMSPLRYTSTRRWRMFDAVAHMYAALLGARSRILYPTLILVMVVWCICNAYTLNLTHDGEMMIIVIIIDIMATVVVMISFLTMLWHADFMELRSTYNHALSSSLSCFCLSAYILHWMGSVPHSRRVYNKKKSSSLDIAMHKTGKSLEVLQSTSVWKHGHVFMPIIIIRPLRLNECMNGWHAAYAMFLWL